MTKTPKLYFYDTGLACHLLGLQDPGQVETFHQRGSLFENLVIAELLKRQYNEGRPAPFYHWRDSNGVEIDLVVEAGQNLDFYEMKYSFTPTGAFTKNLRAVRKIEGLPGGANTVVYAGDETQRRSEADIVGWQAI